LFEKLQSKRKRFLLKISIFFGRSANPQSDKLVKSYQQFKTRNFMPKGVYKRTKEHRKNRSKALKGKPFPGKPFRFTGQKHTEEAKKKMREKRKGRKPSLEKHWKLSDSEKEKIRKAMMGNTNGFGKKEQNLNWIDGRASENHKIRASVEYHLWRESVYARDNWTCQKCGGKKGGNLIAHHTKNFAEYPKLRISIENGITFCKKCHNLFHKIYGCKNNNEEQLEEFLSGTANSQSCEATQILSGSLKHV